MKLICQLIDEGVNVNVTAVMSRGQIEEIARHLSNIKSETTIVSVFAGRIADTGVDPLPLVRDYKQILSQSCDARILWASTRQALDIKNAEIANCDYITVTPDVLAKRTLFGKDLDNYSKETSEMFAKDSLNLDW